MTKRLRAPTCRWREKMGFDEDFWETACGEEWVFPVGGPDENKMKFCPVCGRPLKLVRRKERR